jgi:HlyD family secretion protein
MPSCLRCLPLLMLAAVPGACGGGKSEPREALPPLSVTVATVAQHAITGAVTASGRLLPREEAGIAADLNGFHVADVLVEEGATVRRGQVLAILDDSLLRAQVDQVRAALAVQRVAVDQASEQAARVKGLEGAGVISDEDMQSRRNAVRSAQAAMAVTRAQLGDLLMRKDHLAIRAPEDGMILERSVRPGDTSSTGSTMFRLARGGLIEAYAELPEADAAQVAPGDPAEVTLASGRKLAGTVRLIGSRVDDRTGLVTVRIALPRSSALRQGGFAEVRFTRQSAVLAVPEKAVQYDADGASLKVIDRNDRVHTVHVRTGRHSQGIVELLDGPPPGSRVAVEGAAFTLDNDKVRIAVAGAK